MTAGDFILHCMKASAAKLRQTVREADRVSAKTGLRADWVKHYAGQELAGRG